MNVLHLISKGIILDGYSFSEHTKTLQKWYKACITWSSLSAWWPTVTKSITGSYQVDHILVHPRCEEHKDTGENITTVYPKKYAHGFCFAVLCCGYTLTDFPISIRLTSLALWQSNDCPSASKATLMNMDKYFMWIHYERLHNHNKAKHNKTVGTFLGIYCSLVANNSINTLNCEHFNVNHFSQILELDSVCPDPHVLFLYNENDETYLSLRYPNISNPASNNHGNPLPFHVTDHPASVSACGSLHCPLQHWSLNASLEPWATLYRHVHGPAFTNRDKYDIWCEASMVRSSG